MRASTVRADDVSLAVAAAMSVGAAGKVVESERLLREAYRHFPDSSGPILGLARLKLSVGAPDQARAILFAALKTRPDMDLALALVAACSEGADRDSSIALLETLVSQTGEAGYAQLAEQIRQGTPAPAD